MLTKLSSLFIYCIVLISFGCNEVVKNKKIVYEAVSDSLIKHSSNYEQDFNNYEQDFNYWKKTYEKCMGYQLFKNAIYMELQGRINVGSINNISATNINGKTTVIDTTFSKTFFDLISLIGASNCYSKINLNENLQNEFYSELKRFLSQSKQYEYLKELIDTNQIIFKITTFSDNSIRPDSLVSILQRTKDTSLLHFKELLLTPGNALLVHDAVIYGFACEFSLKKNLSISDEKKFMDEVFFDLGNQYEKGSIKLLNNNRLSVLINKYYTVFGEFYIFKEVEN